MGLFALVCALAMIGSPAVGHETDQYTVPAGREFADLRIYLSNDFYDALDSIVRHLNDRIEHRLQDGKETPATEKYYAPETLAWELLLEFPPALNLIEAWNLRLTNPALRGEYPGLVVGYLPAIWIYHHPLLVIDPTKLVRLARSTTFMVDGVYLGTDKLAHFVHMGYLYFEDYRRSLKKGVPETEAVRHAIELATKGNFILSEEGVLGMFTTGIRSNADLAANYMGLKFFINLTEPVRLRGQWQPPLLVREGPYWRLNDHVRRNSDFFSVFVSPHWDEALNPCTYGPGIGPLVADGLRKRCDRLREWYCDREGKVLTRSDFTRIADELKTYYGEYYGWEGDITEMVSIPNCCFDQADAGVVTDADESESVMLSAHTPDQPAAHEVTSVVTSVRITASRPASENANGVDALGRTALWWAAYEGDESRVAELIQVGAPVHQADIDGETPLHVAARWGHDQVVRSLLDAGADGDARSLYGMTPLHLAARELRDAAVRVLLEHRVDVNARDDFGCTPLHDVAARGDRRVAKALMQAGADPEAADAQGVTPKQRALWAEEMELLEVLSATEVDR